jgi:hypothetical protein
MAYRLETNARSSSIPRADSGQPHTLKIESEPLHGSFRPTKGSLCMQLRKGNLCGLPVSLSITSDRCANNHHLRETDCKNVLGEIRSSEFTAPNAPEAAGCCSIDSRRLALPNERLVIICLVTFVCSLLGNPTAAIAMRLSISAEVW